MAEFARSQGKFRLLDFSFDLSRDHTYTFWSGLIGGTFVALASHGTDQLMVQRYLSAKNEKVAGFVYIGTPSENPEERERPHLPDIVTRWQG